MRLLFLFLFSSSCFFSCFLYTSLPISSKDLLVFLQGLPSLQDIKTGKENLELLLKKAEKEKPKWEHTFDVLEYYYFVDSNIQFHKQLLEQESLGLFDRIMNPALLKLRKEAKKFLDKAPKARITLFLQELCSTCFSTEEKNTFAYFQYLQTLIPEEGTHSCESSLIEYLHESAYLSDEENQSALKKAFEEEENLSYEELLFIARYSKLKTLMQLFEDKCAEKKYIARLKSYESILKKEFILTHNFQILKDFCDGKILVSSDLEKLAIKPIKKYLRPFHAEGKDFLKP